MVVLTVVATIQRFTSSPAPTPTAVPSSPISRPSTISSATTRRGGSPKANRVARSRARSSALMLVAL